jgi:predicted MPP superfamily phosphohydrolase
MYSVFVGMQTGDIVRSSKINLMVGVVFISFVSKLVFSSLLLFYDGGRGAFGLIYYFGSLISPNFESDTYIPSRRSFITTGAALIAAIPLTAMIYGITKGKYNYTIKDVLLYFKDLPSKFNGLKIVQISDIHSGSFDSISQVERGVEMINSLKPDVVFFTGDLVNSNKDEINPYIKVFQKINAKYGKYAVLGNHDYYGIRASRGSEEYKAYFDDFKSKFDDMGFQLLRNESCNIEIEGESISLIGVENWGAGRYFQKYGDLEASAIKVSNDDFKILLSHDPTHWDEKVLKDKRKFHLTLSGHTHGMQFGIDIPWLKWSPAKYRYARWMGLYKEEDQYLYVNRGFGFLGFPGRVGMWPEITSIELTNVVS